MNDTSNPSAKSRNYPFTFIAILCCFGFVRAQQILPFGSSWEYLHPLDASDPVVADPDFRETWHTPSQYDGAPFLGPSPAMLGYGTIDLTPVVTNIGEPPRGSRHSAYFRKTITTTEDYERLKIEIFADDGGVLYLNGELIERFNFAGEDTYFASSIRAGDEIRTTNYFIEEGLEAGEHVIAFSLHNVVATSSDLGFDLQITGIKAATPLEGLTWSIKNDEVTIIDTDPNSVGDLVIPDTIEGFPVTKIGDSAMAGSLWTSVTLPAGLTEIGHASFNWCRNLSSLEIPPGVTKIGDRAFASSPLTRIVIPEGITEIGDSTFWGCRFSSIVIPDAVTEIGRSAFSYCNSLSEVEMGENVRSIGESAFSFCFSLSLIEIPDSVVKVGPSAFQDCTSLARAPIGGFDENSSITSIRLPGTLKGLGASAFQNCWGLGGIELPDFLEIIGHSAFEGCWQIEEVAIPNGVRQISPFAFSGTYVVDITLPDSLTKVGASAFAQCRNLKRVDFGDGIVEIGKSAFHFCGKLTEAALPDSTLAIGESAFEGCALETFAIPEGVTRIEASTFESCFNLSEITIPIGIQSIGIDAFRECNFLTDLVIPETVTDLGGAAFLRCRRLSSVQINANLEEIPTSLFFDCSALETVNIPASVTKIGASAFAGTAISSVSFGECLTHIYSSAFKTVLSWLKSTFLTLLSKSEGRRLQGAELPIL